MRIVCPSCSATFELPKTRLAPGQVVRCARCGADWTPLPEPAAQPTEPREQPLPQRGLDFITLAKPASPAAQAAAPATWWAPILHRLRAAAAGDPALVAGWAVSIAAVIALAWAAVAWRDTIMQAWPPSERLYTALGLPADR